MFEYDGNAGGVVRLVAYHYRMAPGEKPRRSEDSIRAGVVYIAASCDNPEEFAAFQKRIAAIKIEQSSEGNVWRGKLIDDQTNLEVALDLKSGLVITRKVTVKNMTADASRERPRFGRGVPGGLVMGGIERCTGLSEEAELRLYASMHRRETRMTKPE